MVTLVQGHESIVSYKGHGKIPAGFYNIQEGMPFIDYEYLNGMPLNKIFVSDDMVMDVFRTPNSIARALHSMLQALQYIESKDIVHLDIKPDNIIQCCSGRTVIIDFGLAMKSTDDYNDELLGTLGYHPPEFWKSVAPSAKYDMFSMGVVFYRMLYGERPIDIPTRVKDLYNKYFDTIKNRVAIGREVRKQMVEVCKKFAVPPTSRRNFSYMIPTDIHGLVTLMLHEDYQKRPSASQLLHSDLFTSVHQGGVAQALYEKQKALQGVADLAEEVKTLKDEIAQLQQGERARVSAVKDRQALESALKKEQTKYQALETKYIESEKHRSRLAEAYAQQTVIWEEGGVRAYESAVNVERLQHEKQALEERVKALEQIEHENPVLVAKNQALEERVKALEVQEKASKEELRRMKENVGSSELNVSDKVLKYCEAKIQSKVEEKIQGLQREMKLLQESLDTAMANNDALTAENESVNVQANDLQTMLDIEKCYGASEIEKLQGKLTASVEENNALRTELNNVKAVSTFNREISRLFRTTLEQNEDQSNNNVASTSQGAAASQGAVAAQGAYTVPKEPQMARPKRARLEIKRLNENLELLENIKVKGAKYFDALNNQEEAMKLFHWAWDRAVFSDVEQIPEECVALRRLPGVVIRGTSEFEAWVAAATMIAQETYSNLPARWIFIHATNRTVGDDQWKKIRSSIRF
jgi:hypothetical protein